MNNFDKLRAERPEINRLLAVLEGEHATAQELANAEHELTIDRKPRQAKIPLEGACHG